MSIQAETAFPITNWKRELRRVAQESGGFTLEQLIAKDRRAPTVRARWACYQFLRDRGWSYPEIGRVFERDHTAVMYALRPHQRAYKHARYERQRDVVVRAQA